jgi:hypothetical protein
MALISFREWRLQLEASVPDKKVENLANKPNPPYETARQALEYAEKQAPKFLGMLNRALRKAGNRGFIDDANLFKTEVGILGKIKRKRDEGRKDYSVENLTDIMRASLIMDSLKDAEIAAEELYRTSPWFGFEPKTEPKKGDRTGYYGTYHIDLNVGGMPVELQIMHKGQKAVKSFAHALYGKAREGEDISPDEARRAARAFRREAQPIGAAVGRKIPRRLREVPRGAPSPSDYD